MKLFYFLLFFVTLNISGQGLKFTPKEQLTEVDNYSFDEKGFSKSLPAHFSMEEFVPPIIMQEGGSCVGVSTVYYALSTIYNIENGYTDLTEKYVFSFDPYFIYSILNNNISNCDEGLIMNEAMEALSGLGGKKMFFPLFLTCDSTWDRETLEETVKYTEQYKIENSYFIDPEDSDFIRKTKEILTYNIPVVIGAQITTSLAPYSSSNSNGVSSNGLWSPKDYEESDGGHAMCVIGYDDNKFGGSFRIANSWGRDFGDNGFIWIRYNDFKKYVVESWIIEPSDISKIKNFERIVFDAPKYNGHVYEGQTSEGYFHGYGIYSFNNGAYLSGKFVNGSKEGWFVFIDDNSDEFISMIKYQNNLVIDSKSLGFSDKEEDNSVNELKAYMSILSPSKKVIISNEEPDFEMPKKID